MNMSRSLDGRADFHSLQFRHGFVYGYDYDHPTGELMVTADLEVWDTRSHVRLGDFAVSPADPDVIMGVGDGGWSVAKTVAVRSPHLLARCSCWLVGPRTER